jgi:hypothetical protein
MHKITGIYTISNKEIKFSFDMPKNWAELTPSQCAFVLQTLGYKKADQYTFKTSLLVLIVNQKNFIHLANMPQEDLYSLYNLIDWVFTTRPPAINKFPTLKINKKTYQAPNNSLGNICFGEWCFAYEFYSAYHKCNDILFLNKLPFTVYPYRGFPKHPKIIMATCVNRLTKTK